MLPDRKWARRAASVWFEVATQEKMGRGGGNCFRRFVVSLIAWYALKTWNPDKDGRGFPYCPVAGEYTECHVRRPE